MLSPDRLSACVSVRLFVTRLDQSITVKVRIMTFLPYSTKPSILQCKFRPEILTGSPERGRQTMGKQPIF